MIKQDQLWPGGFRFLFDDELFKPGTDSFLLGSFPRLRRGERVCDLGAGTGLLGLLLLAREPDLQVTNVELQAAAVALAEQNTALNGLPERVSNLRADLREPGQLPKAGSFDLVVSNPPYFDAARGAVAQTESRGLARSDETCTLPQLCAAAGRLLRYGGSFCLVFRAERMPELFACLGLWHGAQAAAAGAKHCPGCAQAIAAGGQKGRQAGPCRAAAAAAARSGRRGERRAFADIFSG